MNLQEIAAFNILDKYQLPIKKHLLVSSIKDINNNTIYPCVFKAQVDLASRNKYGLINFPKNQKELINIYKKLNNTVVLNKKINQFGIFEFTDIKKEYYLSITYDRELCCYKILYSFTGGVDIEKNHSIKIINVDPLIGITTKIKNELKDIGKIIDNVYECFIKENIELLEINPLAINEKGKLVICDCKIKIDDSYVMSLQKINNISTSIFPNNSDVGILSAGAGLGMVLFDYLNNHKIKPSLFIDISSALNPEIIDYSLSQLTINKINKCFICLWDKTQLEYILEKIKNTSFKKYNFFIYIISNIDCNTYTNLINITLLNSAKEINKIIYEHFN